MSTAASSETPLGQEYKDALQRAQGISASIGNVISDPTVPSTIRSVLAAFVIYAVVMLAGLWKGANGYYFATASITTIICVYCLSNYRNRT